MLYLCPSRSISKSIFAYAASFYLSSQWVALSQDDTLPKWPTDEPRDAWLADGWIAGWDLLGINPEEKTEIPPEGGMLTTPLGMSPTQAMSEEVVPDRWADAYFAKPNPAFLIDPQSLLTPGQHKQLIQLLELHAEESAVPVRVFLFGGRQEIPGEWRVEEQAERLDIPERSAVVLVYYLGAPHRCEIYLPPVLGRNISIAEQRRTQESCLLQAQAKVDPVEQLEACLQQLAIRAYWIGHTCGLERRQEGLSPLTPGNSHPKKSGKSTPKWEIPPEMLEMIRKWQGFWPWIAAAMLTLCLCPIAAVCWLICRKRKFVRIEIEPRLGGKHAAGVGAAISFAHTGLSPASQRDRPPDL